MNGLTVISEMQQKRESGIIAVICENFLFVCSAIIYMVHFATYKWVPAYHAPYYTYKYQGRSLIFISSANRTSPLSHAEDGPWCNAPAPLCGAGASHFLLCYCPNNWFSLARVFWPTVPSPAVEGVSAETM